MGNHEFYRAFHKNEAWSPETFPNGETDQASVDRFKKNFNLENVYYDFWLENSHFIILGSEKYRQSLGDSGEAMYISDTQLQWFKQKLGEKKSDNDIKFVVTHIPLPKGDGVINDNSKHSVLQAKEIIDIAKGRDNDNIIFFSGHNHRKFNYDETFYKNPNGFTAINCSTVTNPIDWTKKVTTDGSEGMYVEVYEDRVVVKGRDFKNKQWVDGIEYTVKLQ
jgi:hypothetical protein